jgi:hypothetical protein
MPSQEFHLSRSICKKSVARDIHELLDSPGTWMGYEVHSVWRRITHDPIIAGWVGASIAYLSGEDPIKGMIDAIRHVIDDSVFNKLIMDLEKVRAERRRDKYG